MTVQRKLENATDRGPYQMDIGRSRRPARHGFETANFEASDLRHQSIILAAILPISGFAAKVALGSAIHKHAQEFSRGTGTTKLNGNLNTPAGGSFARDTPFADRSDIHAL